MPALTPSSNQYESLGRGISLRNVSKSFLRRGETRLWRFSRERRAVLRDLNLEVDTGEAVCIMGRNGSGKTTLAKILSTLILPDRGEARICGFDVEKDGPQVRKRVGLMLNAGDMGFQPRLSGETNLEFYAALYGLRRREARHRISELMGELGLEDRGSDQFQSYSSGMRRRLAFARALLPDPSVLVMDEPTLGVDSWTTDKIHKRLSEEMSRGKTILYTTNSKTEAKALTERTLTLQDGILTRMDLPA